MHEAKCQLVHLLAMLRMYGPAFVQVGQTLQSIRDGFSQSNTLTAQEKNGLIARLNTLLGSCRDMSLGVSASVLQQYIEEMESDSELTHSRVALRITHWETTFIAELSKQAFFQLPVSDSEYFWDGISMGRHVEEALKSLGDFKDAGFDIKEAGCCLSLDRPTAAVYHLMRATEYALVATAAGAGVPREKRTSWEIMIGGIHSEIKARVSRKDANWKDDERKYDDLCAWFTTIKNGWRNPSSHIPMRYSVNTAEGMFSAVRTLFEHLRQQGIKPEPMPDDAISLPNVLGE